MRKMKPSTAEPRQKRGTDRRLEILLAARRVFVERGYSGASTDAILERSGGSKETIYAYFGNKLGLFRAVLLDHIDRVFAASASFQADSPEAMLRALGLAFVQSLEGDGLRLARVVVAEADRIADLASQLHEAFDVRLVAQAAAALDGYCERGLFPEVDTQALGQAFIDLLGGRVLVRRLFDPHFEPGPAELREQVDFCVSAIMRMAGAGFPAFEGAHRGEA
jgi:AcrR family transcriptional regulator